MIKKSVNAKRETYLYVIPQIYELLRLLTSPYAIQISAFPDSEFPPDEIADAHGLLIEKLHLISESYDSSEIKKLPDKDNPLNRVNEVHARLKNFLYAHTSFNRDTLQGYLNLFSFTMNPPTEHLEKVEALLNLALNTRKTLRYRSFFRME